VLICPESTCMSLLLIITALCSIQLKSGYTKSVGTDLQQEHPGQRLCSNQLQQTDHECDAWAR
jgi:hypothetical protein